jgi:uncharacterized protein (DUF4415 family)
MKSGTSRKGFPANPDAWERLIAEAPGEDRPLDPQEAAAMDSGFVSHSRAEFQKLSARRRGPNKAPVKERVTLRLSPEVAQFFRSTGKGWQTRLDGALKDWLKTHTTS